MRGVDSSSERSTKLPSSEIDEHLAKSAVRHDDRMRRQRIEQLVRVDDAVHLFRQSHAAVDEHVRVRAQRLDLCIACGLRLFDE